ncbi:uncharacterized protein [Magallana gigas]|uniref:uncharacterized protein isoform X2 n=1 Tax=Magallana gigas TaxID=29159 RepID=UPI003342D481
MVKLPALKVLFIIKCGLLSFVHSKENKMIFTGLLFIGFGLPWHVEGQLFSRHRVDFSSKFLFGDVTFMWTSTMNSSMYSVSIRKDAIPGLWTRVYDTQYTVRDALLYDNISINVRLPESNVDNIFTFKVSKVKTQIGETVNLSWTALFFPLAGQYFAYHTYRENRTIFSVRSNGVRYGIYNQSTKYTYLTRPFTSTNIMFEIKDITLDDAGYYNGGTGAGAAWSGGGVVLIVKGKPSKPKITGDLNVDVDKYINFTCCSRPTSAPDYYTKLVTLSYTWFVNETKMGRETKDTLILYVTRDLKYNRYSCTATEEDMESDRSDLVQINPLYGPDILIITPQPNLNINDKLTVREGETIGPFVCTADCNPPCSITWRVKTSDGFSDARSEMGTLMQQVVQRDMRLFRCKADRGNKALKQEFELDVQYLDDTLLYINGQMISNIELNENAPLRISCHVDGNPTPTIRLSRGQGYTEPEQRHGTWLNYTIDTAQCTDTDTYRCSGTSTGFSNTDKVININVLCNTRLDTTGGFKSTYGSKSGMDTTVNVAVPIIAYPPPQLSDFKWDGPVPVPVTSTISTGDVSYKHVIESFIPVKDHTYFGYYTLSYKGQTVTRITINAEGEVASKSCIIAISLVSILLGLTWFMVAMFVVYDRRYRNIHQKSKHGEESTQLQTQNMTQHYDDLQGTDVDKLEAKIMTQHYDDVQGTVEEGNYTNLKGDNTAAEGDYTELGQRDPETPYEELKE